MPNKVNYTETIHQEYGFTNSLSRSSSSIIYCVFYKTISLLTTLFDQKLSHKYDLLGEYYFNRASAIEAYWLFGNDLICPAVNMERVDKLVRPLNEPKINELFNRALQKTPCSIQLNRNLFPKKKITKGVCFSFSVHFMAKFFKLKKECTTEEAIDQLSSRFQEGSSEKTGIIHGFQNTRTFTSQWWKSKDLFLDLARTFAGIYGGISLENLQLSINEPVNSLLSEKLKSLRNGAYLVDFISSSGNPGHVVVYIKEDAKRYLFDPQLGTVKIPEGADADYLIKSMEYTGCDKINLYQGLPA